MGRHHHGARRKNRRNGVDDARRLHDTFVCGRTHIRQTTKRRRLDRVFFLFFSIGGVLGESVLLAFRFAFRYPVLGCRCDLLLLAFAGSHSLLVDLFAVSVRVLAGFWRSGTWATVILDFFLYGSGPSPLETLLCAHRGGIFSLFLQGRRLVAVHLDAKLAKGKVGQLLS